VNNLPDIKDFVTDNLVAVFAEVHQPRSDFQLEKFVINQHDTNEMRYVQCVTEIQALYYTIKEVSLSMQIKEIEVDRLRETGDAIDELNAQIKELGMEQTRVVGVGAFRELKVLLDLLNTFPAYTRKEIEEGQSEYWNLRLNRQEKNSPNQQALEQAKFKKGELE
jgi:hypothetical protein